jgi:AcrR family transcriptional regulator
MKDADQPVTTRDAILDATDRLLARYGYKKMTIDDLAREVGIGKGSIYLHFTSKEEIVLSHIDRIIERLNRRLTLIAGRTSSSEERLRAMLVERVLYRFDSVQHYTLSLNDLLAYVRPKLLERRKHYFAEESAVFAAVIKEGQRNGEFAGGNASDIAVGFLTATNSLLPYSLSTQELGARKEIERATRRVADLLLKGLLKR